MTTGFTTTRGAAPVDLAEAIFRGLAPDGGLYVPSVVPDLVATASVPDLSSAGEADLRPIARWAAPLLFPSQPPNMLDRVVERAFPFSVPVVEVEPGRFVLELFHGPTHAFKDVGARFMAALMGELDEAPHPPRTVLVATSGDTGGAVADAFHGMPGYRVVVLFPRVGVSERQRRQMTTLGDNVHALSVEGTFDDCQRMVKGAFADADLASRYRLTSANSINIARLLPQLFYYLHAAHRMTAWPQRSMSGETAGPTFVVPSGNLGNLCAGLLARAAGMPARGFVAATNANRAFADFLAGSPFEPRPSVVTSSSAMDVGDPSNLERIRWLHDGDDWALRGSVSGAVVCDDRVEARIAELHRRTGYVLDPHTAVAYEAASRAEGVGDVVILGTAHPAKFPDTVERAIGREVDLPEGLLRTRDGDERWTVVSPTSDALAAAIAAMDV